MTGHETVTSPDFHDGLQPLAALGMPDMKGAVWVKLPSLGRDPFSSYFQELGLKLHGNAWQLAGSPARFLTIGAPDVIDSDSQLEDDAEEETPAKPTAKKQSHPDRYRRRHEENDRGVQ